MYSRHIFLPLEEKVCVCVCVVCVCVCVIIIASHLERLNIMKITSYIHAFNTPTLAGHKQTATSKKMY